MDEAEWTQPIASVEPNRVALRGYALDDLMGAVPFSSVVFLAVTGRTPTDAEGRVFDALLVASVDHGATPPSTLAARTVASTGAPLTTALAAGIMSINRFHGGAIEGCMHLLRAAVARTAEGLSMDEAATEAVAEHRAARRRLPGFGHRVHSHDPRTRRLFSIAGDVGVAGTHVAMAELIGKAIAHALGRDLPINVDGAIGAVLCDMGFPPEIGNGLFAVARAAGLAAHVFDEITNQRPMRRISPTAHTYDGPPGRPLAVQRDV